MGKTLTRLALVAVAIGVNFIPGVGQFVSGQLVLGLEGLGVSGFTAVGIASAVVSLATTAITVGGLQAAAGLAGLGPKAPKPSTTEGPLKTPIPPRTSAYGVSRLYGAYVEYDTADNGTAVDVFAVHDGKIDGIVQRYLGDDKVTLSGSVVQTGTDKRYQSGAVNWYETLGSAVGTAFSAIVSLLPGIWTTNHRGDGVVMVATTWKPVKSAKFQETYPQGGPVPASVAARWQLVFDWRDGTQSVSDPTTWKWSENACLHLAHYKLVREKSAKSPGAIYPTASALTAAWNKYFAPTLAYWTAAANDCDVAMTLKAGGTEPRYRSCVIHKHTDEHKAVTGSLAACFDAWIAPRADGALIVYSGRYYAPTVTIGPDEIIGWEESQFQPTENAVNELVVSYVSAPHDYNTVETDAWRNAADISARGQILSQPLENQVPSHSQARRLAKRAMSRLAAEKSWTVTTNAAGRIARGERYINLLIVEAGTTFASAVVEITSLTRNLQSGGITFNCTLADPNIDAWDPATEEGNPAPLDTTVAQIALVAPTITGVSVVAGPRISIAGNGPARDDLTWYARTRVTGTTDWSTDLEYNDTAAGASVTLLTDVVPATNLDVQIAYMVGDGRLSPYSATATVNATTFSPLSLFAAGEKGAWFDPSDISSMYQDSTGTTAAVIGQPVGRINDKSGNANHATQATAANRPALAQDAAGNLYLSFDGVNDSLATPSIDFTATPRISTFAASYNAGTATAELAELSASVNTNNGSFSLTRNDPSAGNGAWTLRGTAITALSTAIANAAISITSCVFDISQGTRATEILPRVNGAIPSTLTGTGSASAGTGNFGNYPLYIGARAGTSLFLTGRVYGLIVVGRTASTAEIASAENWLDARS